MPTPNRAACLAGAALLATAGCATTPPNINVEGDWRDAVGKLGLFALYPPAEDVQPGDVYLHVPRKDDGRFDLTRITSLTSGQLKPHLIEQQQGRLAACRSGVTDHSVCTSID